MAKDEQVSVVVEQDELSLKVGSVPVIMINFNGLTRRDLPRGVKIVDEYKPEEKPAGQSGVMIASAKSVDHKHTLKRLSDLGFRPVRVLAVLRADGRFKVVVVLPHWKDAEADSTPISGVLRRDVEKMMSKLWNTKGYRNPTVSGGNFIFDLGQGHGGDGKFELVVNGDTEFEFQSLTKDRSQKSASEEQTVSEEKLSRLNSSAQASLSQL